MEEENINTQSQVLNPWLSMWIRPRASIQQIVDDDPDHLVVLLAAIAGIGSVLDRACMKSMGDRLELPLILIIAVIAGPIGGIISLYLFGALLRWTGSWIGGAATYRHVRAAVAWSKVPLIWAMALWIPELALFGKELFTSEVPIIEAKPILALMLLGFGLLEITIGIWAAIIFLKCLGQVQGFSAWRALANTCLAGLVIIIPLVIIVFGVFMLTRLV